MIIRLEIWKIYFFEIYYSFYGYGYRVLCVIVIYFNKYKCWYYLWLWFFLSILYIVGVVFWYMYRIDIIVILELVRLLVFMLKWKFYYLSCCRCYIFILYSRCNRSWIYIVFWLFNFFFYFCLKNMMINYYLVKYVIIIVYCNNFDLCVLDIVYFMYFWKFFGV